MTRRLRVGAIGAGWWATTNHFPLLAARPDVDLVAVCRPGRTVLQRVKERFGFRVATEDYRDLLEQDLDAVVVSTPHHLHYEHAAAALDRGFHVLCEKPMTLRPDHAWDLVDRAARRGLQLLVPFGWNYTPFVEATVGALRTEPIGEVYYAHCAMGSPTREFFAGVGGVPTQWTGGLTAPEPSTWQDPANGGGYAHGQLSHAVALLLWLTGLRAQSVVAATRAPASAVDLYDAAIVTFGNGAIASIGGAGTLPADDKFQLDVRVFSDDGVVLLDVERERAEIRRHDGHRWRLAIRDGEGAYTCQEPVHRFVDLALGREVVNQSPGELGARTVEIIDAIMRSGADECRPARIESGPALTAPGEAGGGRSFG